MRENSKKARITNTSVVAICAEADRVFPLETGGVLMGYEALNNGGIVITKSIGPGMNALHGRSKFRPDYDYQESAIADHFYQKRGTETYLGDWHSHPNATSGELSFMDRLTLKKIANFDAARVQIPIMAILYGIRVKTH